MYFVLNLCYSHIGEYHLRLRQLEKSLLQALNDAKGEILDDDSVVTSLETLKQEASEINNSLAPVQRVLIQVEPTLTVLSDSVLQEQPALRCRKLGHLINEFRSRSQANSHPSSDPVVASLIPMIFEWLCQMRFYFDTKQTDTFETAFHLYGQRKVPVWIRKNLACCKTGWFRPH
jgi:hypothetical protein